MQLAPFPGSDTGQQTVLIDGHTLRHERVDPFTLPSLVADLMRITGQSWKQIVEETPFCVWLTILEAWKRSETQTGTELDIDALMRGRQMQIKGVDNEKLKQFLLTGGVNIKR